MYGIDDLDVLVVYNASVAQSAGVPDETSLHPFLLNSARASYNESYEYFLSTCRANGLTAGLASSADVTGPGICQTYWTSTPAGWIKMSQSARSLHIFDKISPTNALRSAERTLLLSDVSVTPFNDLDLFTIFFDKLKTYTKLPEYAIPTVEIKSSKFADLKSSLHQLRDLCHNHPYSNDFSPQIILKDRYGAGGNYVYKTKDNQISEIRSLIRRHDTVSFVIQPFLYFNKGFAYQNRPAATDIRLIFHHEKLLFSYIRQAKAKDFRCNQHQGGKIIYVDKQTIPDSVHKIAKKIIRRINKPGSLYALDFVISNSGRVYFLEGNIGPGISWDINEKTDVKMCKRLIRSIVGELATRISS
ncbi:MAG: hypothetical protein ACD_40C00202G0004 [uncultured bacterium]|nr:MAG: hypothetical protein ACD_40C00202G0004 [uncultured bacterium]